MILFSLSRLHPPHSINEMLMYASSVVLWSSRLAPVGMNDPRIVIMCIEVVKILRYFDCILYAELVNKEKMSLPSKIAYKITDLATDHALGKLRTFKVC